MTLRETIFIAMLATMIFVAGLAIGNDIGVEKGIDIGIEHAYSQEEQIYATYNVLSIGENVTTTPIYNAVTGQPFSGNITYMNDEGVVFVQDHNTSEVRLLNDEWLTEYHIHYYEHLTDTRVNDTLINLSSERYYNKIENAGIQTVVNHYITENNITATIIDNQIYLISPNI